MALWTMPLQREKEYRFSPQDRFWVLRPSIIVMAAPAEALPRAYAALQRRTKCTIKEMTPTMSSR
jgi:hypothetical protein